MNIWKKIFLMTFILWVIFFNVDISAEGEYANAKCKAQNANSKIVESQTTGNIQNSAESTTFPSNVRLSAYDEVKRGDGCVRSEIQNVSSTLIGDSQSKIASLQSTPQHPQINNAEFTQKIQKLQMPFIANNGQLDETVKFYANTFAGSVFVTKNGEIVYSLSGRDEGTATRVRGQGSEVRKTSYGPQVIGNALQSKSKIIDLFLISCSDSISKIVSSNTDYTTLQSRIINPKSEINGIALKEEFVGGKINEIKGESQSVTKVNYFKGNDPSQWKTNVSTYELVNLGEVYEGIGLSLKAYGNNVEKLFTVKPGASPDQIKIGMRDIQPPESPFIKGDSIHDFSYKGEKTAKSPLEKGARGLLVNECGELVVETELGDVKFSKPVAYQVIDGKRVDVECKYMIADCGMQNAESKTNPKPVVSEAEPSKIRNPNLATNWHKGMVRRLCKQQNPKYASLLAQNYSLNQNHSNPQSGIHNQKYKTDTDNGHESRIYGFKVASYDKTKDLVIDPLLASTYLGGSGDDYSLSIVLDSSGNVYVTGFATSSDLPITTGAYDTSFNGTSDIFISKFSGDLSSLLAFTYIGGSGEDRAFSTVVDASDNIYVTGYTTSSEFPTTVDAYDISYNGDSLSSYGDVFISKLSSDLNSLISSTYLGGASDDSAFSIVLDSSGNTYIAGVTFSSDFPTTTGAYKTTYVYYDAFISKLNSDLSNLLSSTYLGGASYDYVDSITLDINGNLYLAGFSYSSDFPTTIGAYDASLNGPKDVFISKLNSDLNSLIYSTYLGGSSYDEPSKIALDASGSVYLVGETYSSDFPTTTGAYDTSYNGGRQDAFISKLSADLSSLFFSTYLGGTGNDAPSYSMALDTNGNVYVASLTSSSDFPTTTGAYDTSYNGGGSDAFISKLSKDLSSLLSSTYLGGSSGDGSYSVVLDTSGNVYVTGHTLSSDFPTNTGIYDTSHNGNYDVFISKLDGNLSATDPNASPECSVDSYTKLLIHGDSISDTTGKTVTANGDAAVSNAGKTVTTNGNAQIDTAQGKFGGASGYFDGSGDYLTVPDSDDWNFGSEDFTIDFWVRFNTLPSVDEMQIFDQNTDIYNRWSFYRTLGGAWRFDVWDAGVAAISISGSSSISTETWYHISLVRSGNNFYLFQDGTQIGTTSSSLAALNFTGSLSIASTLTVSPRYLDGWLDEVRISKGIARWTSDFTPTTEAYTSDNCTKLLLHFDGSDGSTSFTDSSRDHFKGKAISFDGSGDYLPLADSDDWYIDGNFTCDFSVRFNALPTSENQMQFFLQTNDNWQDTHYFYILNQSGLYTLRYVVVTGNVTQVYLMSTWSTPVINTWYHLAIVRNGNVFNCYVDGISIGNSTNSVTYANLVNPVTIGAFDNPVGYAGEFLNGWIDEFRWSKGTARWTSDFCPPNAPYCEDTTPPTVSSTSPVNNATGVAVDSEISATFSEGMNSSTINTSTFTLSDSDGNNISGTVSFDCCSTTATFTPSSNLAYATTYTAKITTGAEDQGGNPLAEDYLWTFTTVSDPNASPECYQFVTKWGSQGTGDGQFDIPVAVAMDSSGNIYVTDTFNHRIQKFDSSGTFITKWGSYGSGDGQFNSPHGIALDTSGNVYVTDYQNNRVQKFDSSGTFITKWGSYGSGDGQFHYPYGVAVDSSGNVYVVDNSNHRIQKFDSNGTFITKWGSQGSEDGQFWGPHGIAVDSSENVYIVDNNNNRIQKFDSNGNFIIKWGLYGTGDGQFNSPVKVTVDSSGDVYVADGNHRIQKFSSSGIFITKWGSNGTGDGQFNRPYGVVVDSSGNVYVVDSNNSRIQEFSPAPCETITPTPTPVATPTISPIPTATQSPIPVPSTTPTPTVTPIIIGTPTPIPSPTPSPTPDTTPPTVSSTSPAGGASGVAIGSVITVTFSEPMDASTIGTSTFIVRDGNNTIIDGTVSYSDSTATFTPSSNLGYSTTYMVTITGVKDLAGNAMEPDFTFSFTTGENPQPVANAGPDQTVNEGELVSLQGGGTAPQGVTLTYQWTQVAGPDVTLSDSNSATPTFTAPQVNANVTLTFQLVVSYENYTSDPDTVDVTIINVNHAPIALTGDDQTVDEGTLVTLHGESSYDPDGSEITYQWTQVRGPTVTLSDSNSVTPTFTTPSVTSATLLEFELVVNDGELSSDPAVANVTVEHVNHAPVADTTGSTQTVDEETQVTLDGSQSSDPDGDSITYQWTQVSGPTVTLSDLNSANPSFTAPQVTDTTYLEFKLVVNDGQRSSEPAYATVTVLDTNQPIDCSSAAPSTATLWPPNHKLVSVSIEGVTDPDNEQVTITITGVTQDEPIDGLGDGDTSPDAVIQGDTVLLRAERSGTGDGRVYEVHFTADDGQGGTCDGSVKVSVPHDKKKSENATDSGQNYDSAQQ